MFLRVRDYRSSVSRFRAKGGINDHECPDADRGAGAIGPRICAFSVAPAPFIDDLKRDGMLHAVVLRSSVAHGRIRSIDTSAARAMPGVHAVITAADIETVPIHPAAARQPAGVRAATCSRSSPRTRSAMSASRSRWWSPRPRRCAEDALEAIAVDIERLPAVADRHAAASGQSLLFEATGSNRVVRYVATFGDADAAFAKAEYTPQGKLSLPSADRTAAGDARADRRMECAKPKLTVFGASKVLFFNRRALAPMLGVTENDIDMIEVDVGGGFGVRGEFYPEDFLIPFAARRWSAVR